MNAIVTPEVSAPSARDAAVRKVRDLCERGMVMHGEKRVHFPLICDCAPCAVVMRFLGKLERRKR